VTVFAIAGGGTSFAAVARRWRSREEGVFEESHCVCLSRLSVYLFVVDWLLVADFVREEMNSKKHSQNDERCFQPSLCSFWWFSTT
jgi:hypothetical protein